MEYKLITAIVMKHKSKGILENLAKSKGIITANKSNSRGTSVNNKDGVEMETISLTVDATIADEIFEYIFLEAELFKEHYGIIYQNRVKKSSNYELPNL